MYHYRYNQTQNIELEGMAILMVYLPSASKYFFFDVQIAPL